jgi:hypothetical protein
MDVLSVVESEVVAVIVQAVEAVDVQRAEVLAVDVQSVELVNGESVEIITETVQTAEVIEHTQAEVVTDQAVVLEVITSGIQLIPAPFEESPVYAKRVDFISDALIYRGEAAVGTANAQPLWRICRITIGSDDDVTEEWAAGTAAFDKVWADRAALGYS